MNTTQPPCWRMRERTIIHVVALAAVLALGGCDRRTANPPAPETGGAVAPAMPMPPASAASR
jgi:hypothetical protein